VLEEEIYAVEVEGAGGIDGEALDGGVGGLGRGGGEQEEGSEDGEGFHYLSKSIGRQGACNRIGTLGLE
jgi:hypothetical protein